MIKTIENIDKINRSSIKLDQSIDISQFRMRKSIKSVDIQKIDLEYEKIQIPIYERQNKYKAIFEHLISCFNQITS